MPACGWNLADDTARVATLSAVRLRGADPRGRGSRSRAVVAAAVSPAGEVGHGRLEPHCLATRRRVEPPAGTRPCPPARESGSVVAQESRLASHSAVRTGSRLAQSAIAPATCGRGHARSLVAQRTRRRGTVLVITLAGRSQVDRSLKPRFENEDRAPVLVMLATETMQSHPRTGPSPSCVALEVRGVVRRDVAVPARCCRRRPRRGCPASPPRSMASRSVCISSPNGQAAAVQPQLLFVATMFRSLGSSSGPSRSQGPPTASLTYPTPSGPHELGGDDGHSPVDTGHSEAIAPVAPIVPATCVPWSSRDSPS